MPRADGAPEDRRQAQWPWVVVGAIRDGQGFYFIAWITVAILCMVATAGSLTVRRDPDVHGLRARETVSPD